MLSKFVNHWSDYRLNWTPLFPITIINQWKQVRTWQCCRLGLWASDLNLIWNLACHHHAISLDFSLCHLSPFMQHMHCISTWGCPCNGLVSHPGDNMRFTLSYLTLWKLRDKLQSESMAVIVIWTWTISKKMQCSGNTVHDLLHMVHRFLEIFKLKSLDVNSPLSDSVLPDRSIRAMRMFFCPFRTFGGHHMNNCFHPFSDKTKH